jgi:2'-5' RNA ligase
VTETALVVEVPEAQEIYDKWVDAWDPPPGAPVHVTLLIPFGPVEEHHDELRALFAAAEPFSFRLSKVERFPETTWLSPEPAERFVALTEALVERFPDYPPYGGIHHEIVPHLTIVSRADPDVLARAEAALTPLLPIAARAEEVLALEKEPDGIWERRGTFRLGT